MMGDNKHELRLSDWVYCDISDGVIASLGNEGVGKSIVSNRLCHGILEMGSVILPIIASVMVVTVFGSLILFVECWL